MINTIMDAVMSTSHGTPYTDNNVIVTNIYDHGISSHRNSVSRNSLSSDSISSDDDKSEIGFDDKVLFESSVIKYGQRHAYLTWVIYDGSYITGALVLASSLQFYSPGILRICLISPELETAKNLDDLQAVFNYVIVVDLIYAEGIHPDWTRFEEMYRGWIDYSFTRLQCLRIGQLLKLEKIIIFDADCLAVGDLSELFDLPTPAGILSLSEGCTLNYSDLISPDVDLLKGFEGARTPMRKDEQIELLEMLKGEDGGLSHAKLHGKKIPDVLVSYSVATNYGIRGALMVLSPSNEDFEYLINIIKSRPTKLQGAIGSYGDKIYHIGPDERLLTEALQKKYGWTHIHPRFCMTAWHLSKLRSIEIPKGLHFVSKKPWEAQSEYFKDFDFWYLEALNLVSVHSQLQYRFRNSFLRLSGKGKTVDDFSSISRMGFHRFWDLKIASSNSDFKGRQQLFQLLTRKKHFLLRLPSHPLCQTVTSESLIVDDPSACSGPSAINGFVQTKAKSVDTQELSLLIEAHPASSIKIIKGSEGRILRNNEESKISIIALENDDTTPLLCIESAPDALENDDTTPLLCIESAPDALENDDTRPLLCIESAPDALENDDTTPLLCIESAPDPMPSRTHSSTEQESEPANSNGDGEWKELQRRKKENLNLIRKQSSMEGEASFYSRNGKCCERSQLSSSSSYPSQEFKKAGETSASKLGSKGRIKVSLGASRLASIAFANIAKQQQRPSSS